jgi:DNA-binding XRE family transcriptional regulator
MRIAMPTTKNLAEVIRRKLASDADLAAAVESERFRANVSAEIYQARIQAELTQKELAERVGMQQSAIARLEDADYDGHSLKTLKRIAHALGKRVEIAFVEESAGKKGFQRSATRRFPVIRHSINTR